ncbi:putative mitochondrial ribosomal death-associated protein 3 [Elsinoe fawcettii]|nr:putative mitochondrial ribosomal death-associated protein 3 [Elsinoe fawcettii]
MATNICLRCLARPTSFGAIPVNKHAFSTTSRLAAKPAKSIPKKKSVNAAKGARKGSGAFSFKGRGGRQVASGGSRKDPAALKAMRKRIVLSNTNALEVEGLRELKAENATQVGEILTLNNESIDALRAAEAFKHNQGWNLFRRPSTLVTQQTRELASIVSTIAGDKSSRREIIAGERGSGKSVLALQAKTFAFQKGWVVIHIPEAQDLSISHTSYAPLRTGDSTLYTQPEYLSSLLARISKSSPVLANLSLSQKHTLPMPIQPNISLARLCDLGASDESIAHPIFTALLTELLTPSTKAHPRPPLLFSLDGFPHIARKTDYLDAASQPIHGFDLTLVRTFIDLLSGVTKLPNGGLVLAVDSGNNRPSSAALDFTIASALERQAKVSGTTALKTPFLNPYVPFDKRVTDALKDVHVRHLAGLSKEETKGVMEYYARSGIMRGKVDERAVSEAWTLGGGGTVGEIEAGVARLRVL